MESAGELRSARICAYRRLDGAGPLELVYARDLGAGVLDATRRAFAGAPVSTQLCKDTDEVVVLESASPGSVDPDSLLQERFVFDLTCGHVTAGPGLSGLSATRRLTEATVQPWATGGVGSVLVGPSTPWVYDYFIGMQG